MSPDGTEEHVGSVLAGRVLGEQPALVEHQPAVGGVDDGRVVGGHDDDGTARGLDDGAGP